MQNEKEYKAKEVKPYTKEEVDKILTDIDNKLFAFIKEGNYKDVLLSMGNLGKYSFTNQIYILLQNPEAKTVNGMRGWNYLGRSIKPGEKALKIFSPITESVEEQVLDSDGNPKYDEAGEAITKTKRVVKGFKPSFVFDISQTKGKELKVFKMDENTSVEDKEIIIKGLTDTVKEKGYTVGYASKEELGEGCYGLCNHSTKEIKILENMSDLQTVSTLVHECGHCLAHSDYRKDFEGLTLSEKREIKEVEAESIACVTCSHLGLDTTNFNFSYITGWSDGDISKFRKNMDVIGTYAGQLITGIDEAFEQDRRAKAEKRFNEEAYESLTEQVPQEVVKKKTRSKKAEVVLA